MAARGSEILRPKNRSTHDRIRAGSSRETAMIVIGAESRFKKLVQGAIANTTHQEMTKSRTIESGKKVRGGGDNHHRAAQH